MRAFASRLVLDGDLAGLLGLLFLLLNGAAVDGLHQKEVQDDLGHLRDRPILPQLVASLGALEHLGVQRHKLVHLGEEVGVLDVRHGAEDALGGAVGLYDDVLVELCRVKTHSLVECRPLVVVQVHGDVDADADDDDDADADDDGADDDDDDDADDADDDAYDDE